jgi:cell division protein FtsQ
MTALRKHRPKRTQQASPGVLTRLSAKLLPALMIMLLVATIYGADYIYKQIDTPLSRVMVGGEFKHLKEAELATLVRAQIDGGFLSMNLIHLQNELQSHPWIHQVSVRREWPSTLKVEVVEEVPIARWGQKGFLNRLGDQLAIKENSQLRSLPVLQTEFGKSQDMVEQYQLISELLIPVDLKLTELQRNAVGAWQVDTTEGVRLILGRGQIVEKMRRLAIVWQSELVNKKSNIAAIDLRYPNGLAVSWRQDLSTVTELNHQLTAASNAI